MMHVRRAMLMLLALACATPSLAQTYTKWYLAEGATTATFIEEILLANPNAASAAVTITFLKSDGTTVPHQLTLAANSRATVNVNGIVANDAVSAVVDSSIDIVVERTMYFPGATRRGGHTSAGVLAPALQWHLAEGATGFFNTFLLLSNPSTTTDAQVRVTFLRSTGAPVIYNYTVAKNSRYTVWVNAEVPELANSSFSTTVDSTNAVPIIVERSMYWNNFEGGHETVGVPAPNTTWRFAEGYTANGFSTFLLLGNPSASTTANVTVTYYLENAAPVVKNYAVGPQARLDVWVNQIAELQNVPFSMLVQASSAVVAERAMYWGNFIDGHSTAGLTQEATKWGFAEGLERGHNGTYFSSFFLLANATGTPASMRATFYREDGTGIQRTFTIPANARYTLIAAAYPELANQRFAAFFESTNAVPVIAERAVYWDGTFYAGTGSAGIPWTGAITAPPAPPAPTLSGITPPAGSAAGGTVVSLTGTNFGATATVTFDGVAASSVGVVNSTTIVAVTPAHAQGVVDVAVTTNGTALSLNSAYTYEAPAPPPPPPTSGPLAIGGAVSEFCDVADPKAGAPATPIYRTMCSGPTKTGTLPLNYFSLVNQLALERRGDLLASCVKRGGNINFIVELARRLRAQTGTNRWGLNYKRGGEGISDDIVTYFYGPAGTEMEGDLRVYIIDVIGNHCPDTGSPGPNWQDQTSATRSGGTVGRWTTAGRLD